MALTKINRRQFATGLLASASIVPLTAVPASAADKSGNFTSHKRYKVRGKATLSSSGGKSTVKLSGFRTTPGPDLYVYVGNGSPSKLVGKLKANSGSQSYSLSGSGKYSTVHIHCKRFNSTFGTARLR